MNVGEESLLSGFDTNMFTVNLDMMSFLLCVYVRKDNTNDKTDPESQHTSQAVVGLTAAAIIATLGTTWK